MQCKKSVLYKNQNSEAFILAIRFLAKYLVLTFCTRLINETADANIVSGLRDVEMREHVINKKISTIRIINENKKIYAQSLLEYDIDLTRAIIFTLASGEEICFEKDSWIFSEEIIINRGHNLINVITSPNDFYERIAEEPDMRGELTRSEIILT